MGKGLIIVESPAKAKTIGKFLNNQYIIKASMGHIRDLPKSNLGVDVENNFKAHYIQDRKKSKVIKALKEAAKDADEIYLASDHDREGEAIAWHLSEILKKEIKGKDLHRIVFNEITKKAIQNAIKNPGVIDQSKVDAQQARRILDRIVGYKISPMLWKVIAKNLSAGRVQSVALRLICEREDEIKAFKPEEYWSIESDFFYDKLKPFKAKLSKWKNETVKIGKKEEADAIINQIDKNEFNLSDLKFTTRKVQPYPAYITSTLQQDASRLMQYSAKRTMQIAQQLYEGIELSGETVGLISYMRTDSVRLADEAIASCRSLISERFGTDKVVPKERKYKNKNSAQDAHEAIRPTDAFRTPELMANYLTKEQLRLYTLIWQRFIATQMKPISLRTLTLEISSGDALFKSSGATITEQGFREVYPHINLSMGNEIDSGYEVGQNLESLNLQGLQHFTKPPARFSEASLIKELESKGIGRPSTYATITNTIRIRQYVTVLKKNFIPTELGYAVNKFLVQYFTDLFNVKFTALMEGNLDQVEYGKQQWQSLLEDYYKSIINLMEKINLKDVKKNMVEETDIVCEKCGSKMVVKWSSRGQFLACSNYPNCSNIKNFKKDENGKIEILKPETVEEKCPKCKGDLIVKNGKFGKFIACSNYPDCSFTKPFTLGIKCPKCNEGEIVEKRSRKGKVFYGCSAYPKCDFMSYYKPLKIQCPECNNPYIEEKVTKSQGIVKKCPKCGKEVF